ncbi:truB pseudouridylate synthase family protein [Streptococcus pneumoniae GA17371]|nr:truB pseudouridylate synthase family protein [Streptococcus pneumoniae GA17371]
MTSHDAVFKLRKILGTKKIGHGGTLDPDVVGVLPIAVGKATRMVEFMQDEGKIYEGEITLGYSTKTEDASGEVVAETFERTSPISYDGQLARFTFRVKCSKGTYIRTLSVDLGEKLGYAAHMSHLTRTSAAGLQLEDALALEEIAEKVEAGQLDFLHPLEIGTGDLVKVFLTPEEATEVRFGRFIELDQTDKELAAFEDDKLLAILEKRGNLYKPRKVFS